MKRILFSAFLTLLANALCILLWNGSFVRTLFNKEACLRLCYDGKITAEEPFHFQSHPSSTSVHMSYEKEGKRRSMYANFLSTRKEWQKLSVRLEVLQDGKISIVLSGPETKDDYGYLYSVLTDWKNFKINGQVVFNEPKSLSYQKGFSKQISVRRDEILHIEAEFRRHHFTIHDFVFLKHENLWYFITGNLLFFFLIYRLLDHFVKQRECLRLNDTLLVVTFFFVLLIPMIDISDGKKSIRENRVLAVKPEIREIFKEGVNTGGGYEKWFNDHFCGRTALIKLHNFIEFSFNKTIRNSKAVWFKENGWLMQLPEFGSIMNPDYLRSIQIGLIQLNQFCQKNKIKLYVLEVPKREIVYKGIVRDKYGFNEKTLAKLSQERETIRRKARLHGIPYIYPYNALCDAARQDLVFFQRSIHLTETGAFITYKELMQAIVRDFPDMPVVSLNDFQRSKNQFIRDNYHWSYGCGDLFFFLGFEDDPNNRVSYNYYDHKNSNAMTIEANGYVKNFTYPNGKHKIMLVGSSNNQVICRFLPFSAAQTKLIQTGLIPVSRTEQWKLLKLLKDDILSFKPDILILSIVTDNLPQLRKIGSTK